MMSTAVEIEQRHEAATVSELVVAAQAGDSDAMGELFRRYHRHVVTVAQRRLRDETEAQELSQEVFVQVLLKISQLRQPECFVGWLTSITKRMAINRVLRRPPVVAAEPQVMEAACLELRTPPRVAEEVERAESVHHGLSRLRDLDRQTLEAFYVRGRSLLEMSDEFQAPVGTIKRRLHEARKRLAKEMEALEAA